MSVAAAKHKRHVATVFLHGSSSLTLQTIHYITLYLSKIIHSYAAELHSFERPHRNPSSSCSYWQVCSDRYEPFMWQLLFKGSVKTVE